MSAADDEPRTVFVAGGSAPPSPAAPAPRREGSGIREGDVLNHIFEVRRFLARGGMGEVFEGVNINSDERVAIKVMLPALAADPNIQAMFRKEARTLTRLSNPALVQYRVLAQEPQLDVLYIVTEYIDGQNLNDVLGDVRPSGDELVALTRRLATGLEVAHNLGAIHRDISPDNVLLEDGRLDRAKIIDFGIAKDLDPSAKTVVGDGFAGKLGYVAPEQLGDFDRQIGPWTDVYSLGLVILAVAQGRNPDLSGSFVDAIDKRRKGPDLAGVPDLLLPTLRRMLAPDPAERLRSMEAVLDALRAPASPLPDAAPAPAAKARPAPTAPAAAAPRRPSLALLLGGGAAALAAVAGGAIYLLAGGGPSAETAAVAPVAGRAAPAGATAEAIVARTLPGIGCSWLNVTGAGRGGDGATVALAGAAGDPAAAQAVLANAVAAGGATLGSSDFSEVAPIHRDMCASLDAFRAVRDTGPALLTVAQRKFEMGRLTDSVDKGKVGARAVLNLDIGNPRQQFAFYGIEPSGEVEVLLPDRRALTSYLAQAGKTGAITDLGGDRYRFQVDVTHEGWSGFLLLTGQGGLPEQLVSTKTGRRDPDWARRFASAAAANGWKTQMVWFKTVDEVPN